MRIIILGSNGMLGNYLKTYLGSKYELLALTRKDIDLSIIDGLDILNFFRGKVARADIIINASGIIKQRKYATIDMIMVNSIFPHILAQIKNEVGCNIIHITTDCVFSGNKGGYVETDEHDCTDDYGKSKSLGENPTLTIIRTSIIGEEKTNKKSLLEWVKSNKGKTIDGFDNHLWNGVTCLELTKFMDQIIQKKTFWAGVRHIFSPNIVSKYELVNKINEIYNLNITINKKSNAVNCRRNLSTLFNDFFITKPLTDQITELKKFKLAEVN
ncbi:NAD-dependent epimerase/dehydratase family protein [Candidatus Parcubacteria bacterium]|jgi:dTDP-4-dehydrorhamnose reductase|nr:MAG: NAD-dependent epimerase/dehydratase family protein [Candidatus Parcubacteria bacterium]